MTRGILITTRPPTGRATSCPYHTHSCHIGIPNGSGSLTINRGGSVSFSNYAALGWDHLGTLTINKGGSFSCGPLGIGAYVRAPGKGPGAILNMNGGTLKAGMIQATSDKAVLNLAGGAITSTAIRMPASEHDAEINLKINGLKNGTYTLIENKGNGMINFTGKVNITGVSTGSGAKVKLSDNAPGNDLILTIRAVDTRPNR